MKIFIENGFITSCGTGISGQDVSDDEFDSIANQLLNVPTSPEGCQYKLRADNLEWELVKLPPVEPEPLTDEEALTRYSNTITGANDQTLVEAAETLITERIKED